MLFNPNDFKSKFEHFKKLDNPTDQYSFGGFWKWKLATENESAQILDEKNLNITYDKLSKTLRKWKWARSNRPSNFDELAPKLLCSLKSMRNSYNELRKYSLLEIEEISEALLKNVWDEIGCVKSLEKNRPGYYLVMGATKPLMFLWGQTPAFDSVVRKEMPKFGITGLTCDHWNFEMWKKVLASFKDELEQQHGLIEFLKQMSKDEYNTDRIVPYGQFIDLYYWTPRRKSFQKVAFKKCT